MLKSVIEIIAPLTHAAALIALPVASVSATWFGPEVLWVAFAAGLYFLGRFGLRALRDDQRGAVTLQQAAIPTPVAGLRSALRGAAEPHRAEPRPAPFEIPAPVSPRGAEAPQLQGARRAGDATGRAGTDRQTLERLRLGMDEVSYQPGAPNVLALTKHVPAHPPASAAPRCDLTRTDEGDTTTVRLEGSLDVLAAAGLRPALEALVAERRAAITVDLSGLSVVDGMGVGLVVALYKRATAAGIPVVVRGLRDQPLAVFRLMKLDRVLDLQ